MSVKARLIPVLLLKNGLLVRSEDFQTHQIIGNPYNEVARFNQWNVDELVYLDITREGEHDLRRDDLKHRNSTNFLDILENLSLKCFMPLTCGGRIRSIQDMRERFLRGADKVIVNTQAVRTPSILEKAASVFGRQAVVLGMDVKCVNGREQVCIACGQEPTGLDPVQWAQNAEKLGAGEILLQRIERDGKGLGYDTDLIQKVTRAVNIPVIACSGVGQFTDYAAGIRAGASAVAAANIWHFKELSDRQGKRALHEAGINVRLPFSTDSRPKRRRQARPKRQSSPFDFKQETILA